MYLYAWQEGDLLGGPFLPRVYMLEKPVQEFWDVCKKYKKGCNLKS